MKLKIKECDWEITTKCNLNCKHCLIKRSKRELNTKECFKVIDNISNFGCKKITFTGGEPLSKKNFFKILEYSSEKNIENWVFTNGTLINNRDISEIKRFITYVGISLDGLEKENDFLRGKGSFKAVLKTIKLFNDKKIPFGLYLTLNKANQTSLNEILILFKKFNPINISINELVKRGNASKHQDRLFFNINKTKILEDVKKIYKKKFSKSEKCQIVPGNIFIDPIANIYGCTEIKQIKPNKVLGNFLRNKYSKYLKFEKNLKLKKNLRISCPYECYSSDKVSINFLSGKPCSLLK